MATPCDAGIGIINFLQAKNFFITGATGMVGKAFVEKLLRTTPNVGRIFLLIKANGTDDAVKRLKNEIIDADLFHFIKEKYGRSYEGFMMEKIVPVVGNIGENNLGMDFKEAEVIAKQIHVIVHSAANTTYDDRYDIELNINTKGPARVLEFAKKCENLRLFLHISTAYVNGQREGIIKEEAFRMGHCIAWERDSAPKLPPLDINAEIQLATEMLDSFGNTFQGFEEMKRWGMERAKMHGWKNTYQMTKAMGEMLLNSQRENVAVVIVRPSGVASSYSEPYPGWIQGNRVLDPAILSYGKNKLTGYLGDPQQVADIVPLDMVVNATIAAMAKHGNEEKSEKIKIYHMTSSVSNPITYGELFDYVYDSCTESPLLDSLGRKIGIKKLNFFKTRNTYVSHLKEVMFKSRESEHKRMQRHFYAATVWEDYTFYKGRFHDENTRKLLEEMSFEEKRTFDFDVNNINWMHYMKNIHVPGLRRHVLKEPNKKIAKL